MMTSNDILFMIHRNFIHDSSKFILPFSVILQIVYNFLLILRYSIYCIIQIYVYTFLKSRIKSNYDQHKFIGTYHNGIYLFMIVVLMSIKLL